MKNVKHIFLLLCFYANFIFSQQNTKIIFNEAYWNAYADKRQLKGKDRAEFISSHRKLNSQVPTGNTNGLAQIAQKIPNQQNNIFAPPCINPDFEAGNLTGWTPTSGFNPLFNILGCCPNGGGQQTIMTGAGLDPYGAFPVVLPGGNFSLRLGNNVNGGQADRIEQTFLVSPGNANFSYKYAVVLQDPNHIQSEQPYFQVEMLDSTNAQVPCTFYYVAAGQNIAGFFNSPTPGVIYKPWTTVLVDLTPYIGQNITIRFSTFDCSLGGHFGYAYIDGVCQSFIGGGSATVCAGATQTFCAPAGLASYTWNGPGVTNFVGQCVNATLPGVYTVQTTLITNCIGPPFTYTLANQPAPVPNAGPNTTVCANNSTVALSGSITGFSSTPQWLTTGSGVFTSTSNLTTTYSPSLADITTGSVTLVLSTLNNGLCPPAYSSMQVIISPAPVVNPGINQNICSNANAILSGTISGPTNTGSWTTNGSGSFNPSPNQVNTTYIPSNADILAGSVIFTLTSTGNGLCNPVSNTVSIAFTQLATVTAVAPQNICSSTGSVSLTGTIVGGTSTGSWSSNGTGTYNPGAGQINTTYFITPGDILAGTITFSLSSTNNGPCASVTNTTSLLITPISTVSAGNNTLICSTNGSIALGGTVNPGTVIWTTTGGGVFLPNNLISNPVYLPSPGDLLAGFVNFTLSSANNGPCPTVQDSVMIPIQSQATVDAGPSMSVCATAGSVSLSGNIIGGTNTGLWNTDGSGTFIPGPGLLNTTYSISAGDILAGIVNFTLTSTNNGPCAAVTNSLSLSLFTLAIVNAGPNQLLCSNAGTIGLNGASTNLGSWATGGAGTFSPNNTFLNATYSISPADILAGFVTFTFSSANNGACPVVQDSVMMTFQNLAIVNAGASQIICSSTGTVGLSGSISGGGTSTGIWSSNGTGAYSPAATSLNNNYFVSFADVNTGVLNFTLTSSNNGPCPAVEDTMSVTIFKIAIVNSGPNQILCSNTNTISLLASITSLSNTGIWTSSGNGIYLPDNLSLNPIYSITPSDVNAGSVTFTFSSTNNGPCASVSDSVKIVVRKMATVNAGPDISICSTATVVALNGNITGSSPTGVWSTTASGAFSPNVNSLNTLYNPTPADVISKFVLFVLSSTNNGVCPEVKDTVYLRIYKNPVIKLNQDTTICSNQNPINITPEITGDFGTLTWITSGLGNFIPNASAVPVSYNIANDAPFGQVTLSIGASNNGACGNISANIHITIRPTPTANFTPSKFTASVPNDPITFSNQSSNANKYQWDFGDGNLNNAFSPTHNYKEVGFYKVELIAMNQYGCADTISKEISVVSDIQFPTVFTPNLGGPNGGAYNVDEYSNDVFFPYTSGVTEYNLKIFNRWGELIFESFELKVGWDGYFKGKLCQQDGYVWKADVKFFDGRTYNKTGSVTLLR